MRETVADELRRLTRIWHRALQQGDARALADLWADRYTAVSPYGAETTRHQDLNAAENPSVRFHRLEVSDIEVTVLGEAAVVSSVTTVEAAYEGGRMEGRTRNTVVWIRAPERWKAIRAHSTLVE